MIYDLNIELRVKDKFKTDFALRIVKYLIKNVKYGEIISYSKIGKEIGSKAYRAIGNVLKKNSLPLIIPCHRVIKA
ncbi:MAG: methylated-DNA--[protein]-cysteine S-methyltransferase, partial [Promethearchaeota archaeon]